MPGIMGIQKIFLELETVFVPRGGLVNGFKPILLQDFTGFDGVPHHPFKFMFGKGYAIHPAPDLFQTFHQRFRGTAPWGPELLR